MSPVPIAFYAPLKPPDHPVPSGDRNMARNLLRGLEAAGFAPELQSRLRTFDPAGDPFRQEQLRDESLHEASQIIARCVLAPVEARPRLWFTYHVYYKAPDWIGPVVAEALAIPYVVAEGSRASKRAGGPWRESHAGAETALDQAALIFILNEADREALERTRPRHQRLVSLPPFLAETNARLPHALSHARRDADVPARLLAVAMMREGDKLSSYRLLAEALSLVEHLPWTLSIVGDGPARHRIERLFAPFGDRVQLLGLLTEPGDIGAVYADHDVLVWPAVNEAFGMALLEAQAAGCPVIAGRYGGVEGVVRDGDTGLLAPPGDSDAFAALVAFMLANPARRQAMGAAAQRFVAEERSLESAAGILRTGLRDVMGWGLAG